MAEKAEKLGGGKAFLIVVEKSNQGGRNE